MKASKHRVSNFIQTYPTSLIICAALSCMPAWLLLHITNPKPLTDWLSYYGAAVNETGKTTATAGTAIYHLSHRVVSSGMLRHVALVRTDVSEEHSASFTRVTRIGEIGTTLAVTSIVPSSPILVTLMKEALSSYETSVLKRATRHNIQEDSILHSHCCENLKSYSFHVN
jgi:hypothetical protein